MFWLLFLLLVSLLLAGAVAAYVGFVRRGEEVPHAPWLGDALKKSVHSLPTLDNNGSHSGKPVRR